MAVNTRETRRRLQVSIGLQFLAAVLIVPLNPALTLFSGAIFLAGALRFGAMYRSLDRTAPLRPTTL